MNANLLSVWRRLYRQGSFSDALASEPAKLLPVEVSTPTVLPTERAAAPKRSSKPSDTYIEVKFASGPKLRIRGAVDRQLLRELISVLSTR